MANNCYVKELMATAINDELVPFGALRVKVIKTATFKIGSHVNGTTVKNLTQNFTTPSGVNEVTIPKTSYEGGAVSVGVTKDDVIEISNKYEIACLSPGRTFVFDPVDFNYIPYLKAAEGLAIGKDLDVITTDNTVLNAFAMAWYENENPPYSRDITGLSAMKHFPNLEYFTCAGYPYIGKLKDLGKCIKLKSMTISGLLEECTVEDFVATMRGAGKTTNSTGITLKQFNGSRGITFNGSRVGDIEHPTVTLTWTATTITVGDVTINNDDVIN